ncbi:MAG: tRNA (cytidine(34)-2'-O)-methyltransferase [Betaproteobacteria bacterium]|nr:tRNA (cytidine(34)-2'-O)-methyltransferase [Betaproteobacteria bacterium]
MFHIVLVHPEIPPNTGNVIRLAANTGCTLHLVEPLGFSLDDRQLRRAGLDYHEFADLRVHRDWAGLQSDALSGPGTPRMFAFTKFAGTLLGQARFQPGDWFVFGAETTGLPAPVLEDFAPQHRLRLPMRPGQRSLNLSNAVAVVAFEAWRQCGYEGGV